ncbi:MAG: DUF4149 domain-containing protein [Gammaproteobacteria bacterium]
MLSPLSLLSAMLLGSMLFFALMVAPSVRKLLDAENAWHYLGDLFPRFYLWGIAVSGAGCLLAAYQRNPAALLVFSAVLCGYLYSRQLLGRKLSRAGEIWHAGGSAQDKAQFEKLHNRSVLVNVTQIVLLGILIFMG